MENENPRNFAIIGVGGYIAPRHLQAIKDTGNNLVAALDPKDSVGIMDRYFPQASFFTEFERFERHVEKLRRLDAGEEIHYISICSPNYLHDSHIRFALRMGANAICEKPLVIKPWNLDALSEVEHELNKGKINTILQLRTHQTIIDLKNKIDNEQDGHKYDIDLTYITPRGKWYGVSWKGDYEKSGGVTMNIGIHFFDMLIWIFGQPQFFQVHHLSESKASGYIELQKARVRWFLSVDAKDLPDKNRVGNKAYRSLTIDSEEFEFSEGFTDLHTEVYRRTLKGEGFGIADVRAPIKLVYDITNNSPISSEGLTHPFLHHTKSFDLVSMKNYTKGENVVIGKNVSIGDGVVIGNNVVIHEDSVIGNNTKIEDNAVIGKRPMAAKISATTQIKEFAPSRIGDGCTIGTGAIIYRGAELKNNVFIADLASIREDVIIGEKTIIGKGSTIENKVTIGNFCKIQANVQIVPYSTIEDNVFISPGVITSNDKYAARTKRRFNEYKGVTLRKGARLGVACVILPGIEIGEDALVGGGAVVTKDVPPQKVVAGVPARIIKDVPSEQLLENQ